MITLAN